MPPQGAKPFKAAGFFPAGLDVCSRRAATLPLTSATAAAAIPATIAAAVRIVRGTSSAGIVSGGEATAAAGGRAAAAAGGRAAAASGGRAAAAGESRAAAAVGGVAVECLQRSLRQRRGVGASGWGRMHVALLKQKDTAPAAACMAIDRQIRWITGIKTAVSLAATRRVLLFTTASKRKGVKVEDFAALGRRSNQLPFLLFGVGASLLQSSSNSSDEKQFTRFSNFSSTHVSSRLSGAAAGSRGDIGHAFLQYILERQAAAHKDTSSSSSSTKQQQFDVFTPQSPKTYLYRFRKGNLLSSACQTVKNSSTDTYFNVFTCGEGLCTPHAAHVEHSSSTASYISSLLLPHLLLARSCLGAADCGLSAARLLHLYNITKKALVVCYGSPALPLGCFSLEEGETPVKSDVEEAKKKAAQAGVNFYGKSVVDECSVALQSVERALGTADFLRLRFGIGGNNGFVRVSSVSVVSKPLLHRALSEKEVMFLYRDVFPYAGELVEKLLLPSAAVETDVLRLRPQYPLEEGSRKTPIDRYKSNRNYLNKIYRRMDKK